MVHEEGLTHVVINTELQFWNQTSWNESKFTYSNDATSTRNNNNNNNESHGS